MMYKICVLLSTYNGGKFLEEQLESIINQQNVEISILVRDDGSSDNTIEILKKWESEGKLKWYTGCNLGPGGSFIDLLINSIDADYFAFCDQDDVWLPNKLSLSVNKMVECENNFPFKPVLIHTDMIIVDNSLNVISPSFWEYSGLRPDILKTFSYLSVCNAVNGCTILLNGNARRLICDKYIPQEYIIHDVISALTVSYYGGVIDYINVPTVLYRQHITNVVGAKHYNKKGVLKKCFKINDTIKKNRCVFRAVNSIGHISFISFLLYKLKYFFIRIL